MIQKENKVNKMDKRQKPKVKTKKTAKKDKSKKKCIIVTGTPCTGKTTIAKSISKYFSYDYIDVNKVIKKYRLDEKYDKKRKCDVVDEKKLAKVLRDMIKISDNSIVLDSHMSHYVDPKYVNLCIVTRCNLKKLKQRLKKRGYDKDKVDENMECEIMQVCLIEAKEFGHNVIEIDTTKKINRNFLQELIKKI